MNNRNYGKLSIIFSGLSLFILILIFFSANYTGSHWSSIEEEKNSFSMIKNTLLILFPIFGIISAFLMGLIGGIFGIVGLLQKNINKLSSIVGLIIVGFSFVITILFAIGMASFRQG